MHTYKCIACPHFDLGYEMNANCDGVHLPSTDMKMQYIIKGNYVTTVQYAVYRYVDRAQLDDSEVMDNVGSYHIHRCVIHLAQHKSALVAHFINCGASLAPTPDKTALVYVTFEYPSAVI